MISGKLDRQITIERPSITHDADYGTSIVEWIPLVALPGSPVIGERFYAEVMDISPTKLQDHIGASSSNLNTTFTRTRIRIRWRDDIDATMRVTVHGDTDRIYQIVGGPVEVGGRKEKIELLCEKYTTDGGS